MPGGWGRRESAREDNLRAQIFAIQFMHQWGQRFQWIAGRSVPKDPVQK
jgi:hypothetical protein